ncbi:MAG: ABC-F family ATP-binding cassette domain-containing protein [Clostridia bacterium]|nr:ABC-F family ATP-binding cassette domain-containing protein [Clostridia bacterium]
MIIISCSGVALSYGSDDILKDITFSVNAGDKVGVIGVNGAGKSTLFSIICGNTAQSEGKVFVAQGTRIGILEQINDSHRFGKSVFESALEAFTSLLECEARTEELRKRIEAGESGLIPAFTAENEKYISNGGNEFRAKTRSLLARFGFSESDMSRGADSLSGGQKTKLLLAKLLLSEPDVILLDEPTNHLDYDACDWLESFITASKKTFLIISHDRYFLDKVTGRTLEIRKGVSRIYDGNYSVFREKRKALDETQLKHYELQQKEIARLEAFIANQRKWNREKNIIAAESRQKTIDKMIKLQKPDEREKGISFSIGGTGAMAEDVLSVRGLSMSYPGNDLFENVSFELHRGERLFVFGANGCGKSTMLKIITGRITPDKGVCELGYNQTVGYYDQEQKLLDQSVDVIEELWGAFPELTETAVRSYLARFGFRGEDVFKPISVLSGGERARLSIAKLVMRGVSLLVLDEPTNHLDIESRETLEDALESFDGTLVAVSHDRYFISRLATSVLEINKFAYPEGYRVFGCGYNDFLAARGAVSAPDEKEKTVSQNKTDYEEAKMRKNRLRSAKNKLLTAEKESAEAEEKLARLKAKADSLLNSSDYEELNELYSQIQETEYRISSLLDEMIALGDEITALEE